MNDQPGQKLGEYLRRARKAKNISTRELSARVGVDHTTIVRFEVGQVKNPRADVLTALATELEVPLSDLYALADYGVTAELPTFAPYLRARYGDLPADAKDELTEAFGRVAAKYGYVAAGPAPGEDEG